MNDNCNEFQRIGSPMNRLNFDRQYKVDHWAFCQVYHKKLNIEYS